MKRAALLALALCILGACTSTPEKRAQAAARYHIEYILRATGSGYRSVEFGPLCPLYASQEDSTVVGYFLDHTYTGGGSAVPQNLCYARLYFGPDPAVVVYHYCHGISWDSAAADSAARAALAPQPAAP